MSDVLSSRDIRSRNSSSALISFARSSKEIDSPDSGMASKMPISIAIRTAAFTYGL
jgi:hypothetical protein